MPQEYVVSVWKNGAVIFGQCVPHGGNVLSKDDAANWAFNQLPSDDLECDIDVSEDDSDDWTTFKYNKDGVCI